MEWLIGGLDRSGPGWSTKEHGEGGSQGLLAVRERRGGERGTGELEMSESKARAGNAGGVGERPSREGEWLAAGGGVDSGFRSRAEELGLAELRQRGEE